MMVRRRYAQRGRRARPCRGRHRARRRLRARGRERPGELRRLGGSPAGRQRTSLVEARRPTARRRPRARGAPRASRRRRTCRPTARPEQIWSMRSSTPGPGRVEVHPRRGDALLVEALAGPVVRRLGRRAVGDRARRGHPEGHLEGASVGVVHAGRRATRGCRRTRSRSSPSEAPAARASATSRGCRTPPSAHTCLPSSRAAAAHSRTARELRPADAGHHPGRAHGARPDADLDDVGARPRSSARVPSAETTLPATTGTAGSSARTARSASSIRSWWPWAVSTTRQSTPASSSSAALAATSPLTPTAAAIRRPPVGVDRGLVERGAQRRRSG